MVSRAEMARLLPDVSVRSLTRAALLGAASSSCSYAAVAMARAIVRKGGDFTSAMAFQFAATNLVLELGVLLWVLMSWHFAVAEFIGGPIMIAVLVLLFRFFLSDRLRNEAIEQAGKGIAGSMEGHAAMSMAASQSTWRERITSTDGWIAVSHGYIMNWTMLWRDIGAGVLVAAALAAWVPGNFWQRLFLAGHPALAPVWGAVVGPLIAVASFTCSVGNVPLAAVLWNGGISFGGVASFIFGDLIILPILNIYRKYYGRRMTVLMAACFYLAMVAAALVVQALFALRGWIPQQHHVAAIRTAITFNYTSILDIVFGAVFVVLGIVFLRTGGPAMLRSMLDGQHDGHTHGDAPTHDGVSRKPPTLTHDETAHAERTPLPASSSDCATGMRRPSVHGAAPSSLSCVAVSKSRASWRSRSCPDSSPLVLLTMRPRLTAGRARSMSAQR